MRIPFVFIWIGSVLGFGLILYGIGSLVINWLDKREYKRAAAKAAEWLGTWGP